MDAHLRRGFQIDYKLEKGKYVEACPAQAPFGKRGNQRGLVDLPARYKRSAKPVSATILSASSSRREIATPSHKEHHPTQQKGPVHPFLRGSGPGTSALCG